MIYHKKYNLDALTLVFYQLMDMYHSMGIQPNGVTSADDMITFAGDYGISNSFKYKDEYMATKLKIFSEIEFESRERFIQEVENFMSACNIIDIKQSSQIIKSFSSYINRPSFYDSHAYGERPTISNNDSADYTEFLTITIVYVE